MVKGGRTESGMAQIRAGTKRVMEDPFTGEKAGKVGSFRSKPWEPPRVQTGRLRANITHELHPTLPIARVGTNVTYGKSLEFGTNRMLPRPWLRPAVYLSFKEVNAVFKKPLGKL